MKKFAVNAYGKWEDLSTVLGMPLNARSAETLSRRLFGSNAIVTHHVRHSVNMEWWEVSIGGEFVADIFLD